MIAAASISSVVLPEPLGPYSATNSPGSDRQRDAIDRVDGLSRAGVALGDLAQLERHGAWALMPRRAAAGS